MNGKIGPSEHGSGKRGVIPEFFRLCEVYLPIALAALVYAVFVAAIRLNDLAQHNEPGQLFPKVHEYLENLEKSPTAAFSFAELAMSTHVAVIVLVMFAVIALSVYSIRYRMLEEKEDLKWKTYFVACTVVALPPLLVLIASRWLDGLGVSAPVLEALQGLGPALDTKVRLYFYMIATLSVLITTQAKRNLSSRSGIGGVLSAT